MPDFAIAQSIALRPRIGLTIGDPAGIGPEISLKAAWDKAVLQVCQPILIGDAQYLQHWAQRFGLPTVPVVQPPFTELSAFTTTPLVFDAANVPATLALGEETAAGGRAAADAIETAVRLCQTGLLAAMTTAPINKKSLQLAGVPFPGHTEFLAHLTQTEAFAMAFIAPRLRVALLTTHIPLLEVSQYVTAPTLERWIHLVHRALQRFGFAQPRLALAGLNPHAGEQGLFGHEEQTAMLPAVAACRAAGIDITGPHPGDTVFVRAVRGEFDLVLSCYHDQGLIPIKCLSFGEAVNVTLGLPIIRTSVDHGTAFDIAGQGRADYSSMIAAICLAAELVTRSAAASQP